LTKSPSFYLIPFIGLATTFHYFTVKKQSEDHDPDSHDLAYRIKSILLSAGAWALIAAVVVFLLWPALWVGPWTVIDQILAGVLRHSEQPHPYQQFFSGRIFQDGPGPAYYLATLAWKSTLVTLPAAIVAIIVLVKRRKSKVDDRFWYYF
jgi:hypothetical protein